MKIIIVQSNYLDTKKIEAGMSEYFPQLIDDIVYSGEFESTLDIIPKDEEIIVITSNMFHDLEDVKFTSHEKKGNNLARLIKEINPKSKVYLFSTIYPNPHEKDYFDGHYEKTKNGWNIFEDIVEVFCDLGLVKKPKSSIKKILPKKKWYHFF